MLWKMPSFHETPQGDMYIEYSVVMPIDISSDTRHSEWDVLPWEVSVNPYFI
jgi:hypothetical protein